MMPRFPADENEPLKSEEVRNQQIRVKNRRKRYLDLHPGYFEEASLELADPLLYDRLVRGFQSASEREKEGRERGYSGILEADLTRSEAKIEAVRHPDPNSPMVYSRAPDGSITAVEQEEGNRPEGRDDGWERWKDVMGLRFVKGDDDEFDYASVDKNDEFDDRAEEDQRRLDEYLGNEEESFVGDEKPTGQTGIQDY